MSKKLIYFDYNATTPLHPEVMATLKTAMKSFGNPSSMHSFGRQARELVETAREKVAALIEATPGELIFVGSGSEANNTVLTMLNCGSTHTCAGSCSQQTSIITTSIEHPCVLETSKCLRDKGNTVFYLDVDAQGKIKIDQLKDLLAKEKIGLVSVMMANNEIGTIQDIKSIAKISHQHGALFHTDAVQAVGKIPVSVKDLDVDFLTISGHKLYGPKGIGALYIRKGVPFCPLIRGGHQEQGRRAGTENTIGIIGMGKAVELRLKEMDKDTRRIRKLILQIHKGIEKRIPDIQFNGHPTDCLPNTVNVSFAGAEGEAILLYLDLEGIAVSTGSACASGSLDPSHVLLATGVSAERAHGSIRISLGRDNTQDDVEYLLDRLPKVIKKIRDMSTAYGRKA